MDAKIFGAFIVQCRKEKHMTQADLAEKLNVTDKAVSRWERGIGFPDINTIEPLASALGITLPELMKSERIREDEVTKEDAAEILTDTLKVARLQRRRERKSALFIMRVTAVILLLILFLDTLQWQMDTIIFTAAGVVFPLFCICGFLALLAGAVYRKTKQKPYKQTLIMALALVLLLMIFMGFFFLSGALGAGPVPD